MTNKEILKKEIGKRVTEIRENKMHMSKNQFAKLIKMQNQYLGTVENGERGLTVEKVIEICNQTGISADYLLLGISSSLENTAKELLSKYTDEEIDNCFKILKDISLLIK